MNCIFNLNLLKGVTLIWNSIDACFQSFLYPNTKDEWKTIATIICSSLKTFSAKPIVFMFPQTNYDDEYDGLFDT